LAKAAVIKYGISNDFNDWRSWLHVAALEYLHHGSGVLTVNLGTGQGWSVLDRVNAFAQVFGREIPYRINSLLNCVGQAILPVAMLIRPMPNSCYTGAHRLGLMPCVKILGVGSVGYDRYVATDSRGKHGKILSGSHALRGKLKRRTAYLN
jgi:hypothetical protein